MALPAPCRLTIPKLCLLTLALSLAWAPSGKAASPSLGGIRPHGGQRGTEIALSFNGARLADAREILFYDPEIGRAHV